MLPQLVQSKKGCKDQKLGALKIFSEQEICSSSIPKALVTV